MPEIQRIDIPQLVKVRKYEVNRECLQQLLRESKKCVGKSNKAIAEALNVPVTKVEHWFRTDSCFAIPDADIWEALKAELGITTTEFDMAITTFEEKIGSYEKSERCYFALGIAPTLTSTSAGNEKIIIGDCKMKVKIKKVTAAAMRGRYDKDGCVQQQIEVSDRECANAFTTVQKDSLVAEPSEEYDVDREMTTLERIDRLSEISYCIDANYWKGTTVQQFLTKKRRQLVCDDMRIRKLTPKECFRLMGFADSDFEKAEAVNSNTQLYKQAGNSIVVPVVQGIIGALIDCGAL